GYVMAYYDADLGNMPVRGNFAVCIVRTDVTSNGLRSDLLRVPADTDPGRFTLAQTSDFQTVRIKSLSTRILPSINASLQIAPDTLVLLAGYRAMSRPNPSALGAGRTFTLGDGDEGGFTSIEEAIDNVRANGSPRLKPFMSWNAD